VNIVTEIVESWNYDARVSALVNLITTLSRIGLVVVAEDGEVTWSNGVDVRDEY
jgi:hypothetical protein